MCGNHVAAKGHPEKVEQAMFGPHLQDTSSTGGEQCGPKKGCSLTMAAAEEGYCSIPITQRSSDQGRLRAEHELEAASSIRSLPPSSIAPSPKSFKHKTREEKETHDEEEESMCK